jgi:membrane protein implicated in regulation of membrane protease activity
MTIWFWFWVVLAFVLFVLEIFTAGFFMLPFGVGAIVAAVLEWLVPDSFVWQWVVFLVVSSVLLLVLRRFADRITHEPPEKVGADRVLGKTGTVVEELDPQSPKGRVQVGSEQWRAETDDGTSLPAGASIVVDRIDGTRLIVSAAEGAQAPSEEE